ncbi:M20/M25/M40 family metallo-hydrolase [Glaciihabitans sp. UYNi722]|uniref:M20/M25/M40 family metallo-hydrolase n=1 Tax=Glaciihabitans sp. UYNi722 TaxID=3156344 RepID=UPI0033950FC3
MPDPIANLRTLVRLPTISRLDLHDTDWAPFAEFIETLPALYPAAHATLTRELVNEYSMLYRWKGRSDGPTTVLMAHYDVVSATDDGWTHPPFGADLEGEGAEQLLWGRGTLDDKGSLVSVLEGVEAQVLAGHRPEHDIYLSFGHDEETEGSGARAIVDLLEWRGIRPGLVIDEGGAVVENIFPGVSGPIAVVGVSEKGILSLVLTVEQGGGHASTPPKLSATARLATAIVRLNRRPFRAGFTPTTLEMVRTLGAHARNPFRAVFTNLWLTKPLLLVLFSRLSDETSAMIRTTQAVTMLEGSQAANALAERAIATVNIRVAIDSSVAAAVEHVRRAIGDPLVNITVIHPNEPSPISPTNGRAWDLVKGSIEETFPGTIVTPYVMMAASDSRHYTRISDHVYRFSPFEMSKDERGTLHAKNERIHTATLLRGVAFYTTLIGRL